MDANNLEPMDMDYGNEDNGDQANNASGNDARDKVNAKKDDQDDKGYENNGKAISTIPCQVAGAHPIVVLYVPVAAQEVVGGQSASTSQMTQRQGGLESDGNLMAQQKDDEGGVDRVRPSALAA